MFADCKWSLSCATKRASRKWGQDSRASEGFNHYKSETWRLWEIDQLIVPDSLALLLPKLSATKFEWEQFRKKKEKEKWIKKAKFNWIFRMIFWKPKIALSTANRIFFQIRNGNRLSWRFPPCLPFSLSLSLFLSLSNIDIIHLLLWNVSIYFFSVATLVSLHMIDLLLYLLFMDVPRARLLWGPDDFYRFD